MADSPRDACSSTVILYATALPPEVFTKRNFVADFIRLKLDFIVLNRFLSHPLRDIGGNVSTQYIARWKPVVDFLFVIIDFFAISYGLFTPPTRTRQNCLVLSASAVWTSHYGWDVTSGNLSKSAFFEEGGSRWAQISDRRGVAHQLLSVSEN